MGFRARRFLLLLTVLAVLGVGVGLGRRGGGAQGGPDRTALPLVARTGPRRRPPVGARLQIQFVGSLDLGKPVDVYDLDLFETPAEVVAQLHAQGKEVLCYLNAGAWEAWRPDADRYPPEVLGNAYEGWPDERWVDVRRIDLLAPILRDRLDLCAAKGFDGVEPDNLDGYQNDTGFPLTAGDQLRFNRWIAAEAHARGLSAGLKNDPDQIPDLVDAFDWALAEECFVQGWCADLLPFLEAGKAVFAVEYTDTPVDFDAFCRQVTPWGISGLLKHRNLDAFLRLCP